MPRLLARDEAVGVEVGQEVDVRRRRCRKLSDARSSTADGNASSIATASGEEAGQQHVAGHEQLHVVGVAGELEAAVPVLDPADVARVAVDDDARIRAPRGAQASANVPSVEALSTTTTRKSTRSWESTESRQRSSVASALRTGMQTATRARALLAEDGDGVAADGDLAQFACDARLDGDAGHGAFIGRGGRTLSVAASAKRQTSPSSESPTQTLPPACTTEAGPKPALRVVAHRVRRRVDDRDRVVVDARHPQLAADPGGRERVRADRDARLHRAASPGRCGRSCPARSTPTACRATR